MGIGFEQKMVEAIMRQNAKFIKWLEEHKDCIITDSLLDEAFDEFNPGT